MPTINLPKRRERARTYNKTAYQKVYQSKAWRRLRSAKLRANPLCERCLSRGKVSLTTEIHHIKPFDIEGDWVELAYDFDNLISLCTACHHEIHQEINKAKQLV